jgi:glycine dehydrogenase
VKPLRIADVEFGVPELAEVVVDGRDAVSAVLEAGDQFVDRHVGPDAAEVQQMLAAIGAESLSELIDQAVPSSIRLGRELELPGARSEAGALAALRELADKNQVRRSLIGMGYADTVTPAVILRNVLENPGWYTQYTPYQAEISQGRLEALLNFQQMVADLTGLPLANASLLDEATAAAEAMAMAKGIAGKKKNTFVASPDCHPQTLGVLSTRANFMGVKLVVADPATADLDDCFGVLIQDPATDGTTGDHAATAERVHEAGGLVVAATDLLACTLITPPGEWGADVAVGNSQRFGVPMGFGGPHAAFMATHEKHARKLPGRLVGVSKDAAGNTAYRLTLQTREQHIRREKATSNICTAQVLLAVMAGMYAVYHGPIGLRKIAERVHALAAGFAVGVQRAGHEIVGGPFFDTVRVRVVGLPSDAVLNAASAQGFNLRDFGDGTIGVSLDEKSDRAEVENLVACFAGGSTFRSNVDELAGEALTDSRLPRRTSDFLTHPVFNTHQSEHELLRYLHTLQGRDLSLTHSMIPLGSCTMKLNAAAEMLPVTWPEFAGLHPYAPADQAKGYGKLFEQLETWLAEITGFAAVSLQPNAGSQGEYAGLLAIKRYHESRGDDARTVCLIPDSAHGTNPASAIIAGMKVVVVKTQDNGDIDLADLTAKTEQHPENLAALMVTYPSTHGVFEAHIKDVCQVVHDHGGQVYMDGANMNAQVGLCRPGDFGADVCHLNLHKTFCIPHGGGGPGMGPIGVAKHLTAFLPGDPLDPDGGAVSAAPFGSAAILPISWMYLAMMGPEGLRHATEVAILSANYMAKRLEGHYDVLFTGESGRVAHEFVVDCRPFDKSAGVSVEDIAKRLMDYGFHAPTMSWPVAGTLMLEPTESEPLAELDRYCDAMIAIREEIRQIETGQWDKDDNPLQHAPHTAEQVTADDWPHAYPRSVAAYPLPHTKRHKFWPSVARVDNVHGDRHVICSCPPMEDYA